MRIAKGTHMKTIILVSMVLTMVLVQLSFAALLKSESAKDSVSGPKPEFVMVDIAGFPFNFTHSGSWRPYQSLRIGYGRDIGNLVELRVFAEYSKYDFDTHDGLSNQDFSRGRRRDFAIYPAIALGIMEIELGGYYTIQDEVIHRSVFSPELRIDPAIKKFGFFIH
jgi:hypothetical protein